MAHSLRQPLCKAVALTPSLSQRCFSQLPRLRAGPGGAQAQVPKLRQQADRSIRVASKEMGGTIPSDTGILDMTFITPTGPNRPSWKEPRAYFKLIRRHISYRFRDKLSLFGLKWASPRAGKSFLKRKVTFKRSTITPTAVALHQQMYTAFAEGDLASLRKICVDGIFETFKARLGARQKGEKVEWELVRYNKRSRLISNRAARFPIEGAAVHQAVVKISSRQKLTRWVKNQDGKLVVAKGSGRAKDVVEYVVVQRSFERWKSGDWHVWGTTKETRLEDIEDWETRVLG